MTANDKKNIGLGDRILGWTFAIHFPIWTPMLSLMALPGTFLESGLNQNEAEDNRLR